MKNSKLKEKYSDIELASNFVFRNNLSAIQKASSDLEMNKMRNNLLVSLSPNQLLLTQLLQLRYQIESYLDNPDYDVQQSFSFYLKSYLNFLNKKNKQFAQDIDIAETELSQILNQHRKPSEKLFIRLEIHSNKIIPAIAWFKLSEREKEYEIMTNNSLRVKELNHVKNKLSFY